MRINEKPTTKYDAHTARRSLSTNSNNSWVPRMIAINATTTRATVIHQRAAPSSPLRRAEGRTDRRGLRWAGTSLLPVGFGPGAIVREDGPTTTPGPARGSRVVPRVRLT